MSLREIELFFLKSLLVNPLKRRSFNMLDRHLDLSVTASVNSIYRLIKI